MRPLTGEPSTSTQGHDVFYRLSPHHTIPLMFPMSLVPRPRPSLADPTPPLHDPHLVQERGLVYTCKLFPGIPPVSLDVS